MTPQQYERVSEIFHQVLELSAADREAFIAAASAGDSEIHSAVIAMLTQHSSPALDLDSPALGPHVSLASFINNTPSTPAPMPASIGPFTIKSALGEGGMSIVYRAHQSFPARDVAVKVLRHAIVSPAALRRFHGEVQALARMTHPNIAQIYDAGTFNDGQTDRPYFAMELVDGLPIADYAAKHTLTTAQRLQLIISVCKAIQHAHLRGIIHRDLKSSNILVTVDGTPKVLDFGIARASDLDVARATMHTESGQILGTLGYMSPEQLTADPLALDLRTDVYALGAVLFETLTGQLPHPIDHLPLTKALRRITDTPPRRLASLRPDLRGDLDVILATALQSDRNRRYQSAQALADDLEAYLAFRPIRARPTPRLRLARMWAARHPAFATALILLVISAIVLVTTLELQHRAALHRHQRDIASALGQASQQVRSYADQIPQSRLRQNELADLQNLLYRFNPSDRALELERREQQLLQAQSDHEAAFHRTLDFLASAERLGVDEPAAKLLYARLYLAREREAEAAGDRFTRNLYQNLVHENDPDNLLAGELTDRFPVTIHTDPPSAQVHFFRLVEQSELLADGEPRLIPIPFNDANPAQTAALTRNFALTILDAKHLLDPNSVVLSVNSFPIRGSLLVTSAPPPLSPLDRLVSIDDQPIRESYDLTHLLSYTSLSATHEYKFAHPGVADLILMTGSSLDSLNITIADPASALEHVGGSITIWRNGQTDDLVIPAGLRFCVTSKPLLLSNSSLLGTAPIENHLVDRGMYIALLLADGCEPLRIPIISKEPDVRTNAVAPPWNLLQLGSTPDNFVRLPDSLSMMMRPLWIMRREVTVAEYLNFLNDPETLATIDNSPVPILVPRTTGISEFGRNADGTYNPGEELQFNWPVPCVNWHDAKAYADWMTRRARAVGRDVHFDLPSHQEWLTAWACSGDNQFPWGNHFRPWWASSNFAREVPQIEPVMSFPIDESNLGVFDLAGSLSEWLDAWWMQSRDLHEFAGGSWGHGGFNYREMFMLYGQNGITSKATSGTLGFRLVMRLGPPDAKNQESP